MFVKYAALVILNLIFLALVTLSAIYHVLINHQVAI